MDYGNFVILNFDLGIKGDYDSLYAFLDNHDAKDCGNSNCFFSFNFVGDDPDYEDKIQQLQSALEQKVHFNSTDRIYAVFHNRDGQPKGSFIIGRRKTPPWNGYGAKKSEENSPF